MTDELSISNLSIYWQSQLMCLYIFLCLHVYRKSDRSIHEYFGWTEAFWHVSVCKPKYFFWRFCCFKSHMQTSTFNNEIGGSYEINSPPMIQPPLEQYMTYLSEYLESPPVTPDSKLKRKAPDAKRDQERKRDADRAYRQRCKVSNMLLSIFTCLFDRRFVCNYYIFLFWELLFNSYSLWLIMQEKKNKNEENLKGLTEENNKLKRENGHIKKEEERLNEVVQTRNGFMKQLQDNLSQLKTQLDNQITLVDVLSKELVRLSFYLLLYFNSLIFLQQSISYIFLQWLYF